jgi:hypothetical protein
MWVHEVYYRVAWGGSESKLGVAPFPTAQYPANPWYAYSYAISSSSRHPEESWLWLHYLSHYANPFVVVPARRSVAEASDYWSNWDTEMQDAIQGAMEHAWAIRLDATTAALEHAIVEIHAGASVQRALNEAQAAVTPR